MKKIIAINNPALAPLYKNAVENAEYNVEVLSEVKTITALKGLQCDLALISPLVYAAISKDRKYKILKNKLLALEDYSGGFCLNFAPNKKKLTKLYTETLNEFVIVCAKLVLSERFGIDVSLVNSAQEADIILTAGNEKFPDFVKLDLTEYWYDTFEFPLILGFWVAKNEDNNLAELAQTVDFLLDISTNLEQIIVAPLDEKDYEKQGVKHWQWTDDLVKVLEKITDLLFYRGFAGEIVDINFVEAD